MADLGSAIVGDPADGPVPQLRQGVVTRVAPLLVQVGSSTVGTPCRALSSYYPRLGDAVSVLVVPGDRIVIGTSSASPTGGQTALGMIAYGAPLTNPTNVVLGGSAWTALTSPLTVATTTGRRYRAVFNSRAFGPNGANGAITIRVAIFLDAAGLTAGTPLFGDHYFTTTLPYGSAMYSQVFNGDGSSHTYIGGCLVAAWQAGQTTVAVYPTEFYIEDLGPIR